MSAITFQASSISGTIHKQQIKHIKRKTLKTFSKFRQIYTECLKKCTQRYFLGVVKPVEIFTKF